MKKYFGQINMTWKKLILFAVIAGIYTGVMASLPFTRNTSFADISITFEVWVLFGILIIMNSVTPLDSALKCFVFFLISQPLVYLVQVPFNPLGWGIFNYYPGWFVWTLCTLPMGFIGHFMKKDNWWGLLILTPALVFVGYHYMGFLREARSFFPRHLLSAVFCAVTVILYPLCIFGNKPVRRTGLAVSLAVLAVMTVLALASGRNVYRTALLVNNGSLGVQFDGNWQASLEDERLGTVSVGFNEQLQDYLVNAELTGEGTTHLILESPEGEKRVFEVVIHRTSFDIREITGAE